MIGKDKHTGIVLICIQIFFLVQVNSQTPSCIFNHYSTHDGLSHSGVMCIHESQMGSIWFGTWDGLNEFDGYNFTVYKSKPGDTSNLSHNRIDLILEDQYGFLWVRTYDDKVHRFDPRSETFKNFPGKKYKKNGHDYHISEIYKSPHGDIWLITDSEGCFRVVTQPVNLLTSVYHYSPNSKDSLNIPDENVNFIHHDFKKNIWISTQKGVKVIFNQNAFDLNKNLTNTKNYYFTTILETKNLLWFGSSDGKLIEINLNSGKSEIHQLPEKITITKIKQLNDREIVIGTRDQGLFIFNKEHKQFKQYNVKKYIGLVNDNIVSIYIDKESIVWIETDSAGVVRFIPEKESFKRFKQKTDKVSPYVYYGDYFSIFEDVNGILWINLKKGGFCYYNRAKDEIEYFYNEPGSSNRHFSNLVTSVMSDKYGNLWMSTHSRGIEKITFIQEKFRHYVPVKKSQILSANDIRSVFEDKQGFLWIGTKEGKLFCYKDHILLKEYSVTSKNPGEIQLKGMVYCITQSSDGALWFGTKGEGIIKANYISQPENLYFKTEQFKHNESDSNSLNHNWIYSIFQDSKNRIWIGTYGGGINLFLKENNSYKIISCNNSQFKYPYTTCSQVRYIQEDNEGRIWVGSTNGLVIISPDSKDINNSKFYIVQKERGNANGLANNDVHYILKDHKKEMWISTFGGGLGKVISLPGSESGIRFKNYTSLSGLPIDIVLSMLEDNAGNLWLSTENGLSRFNPEDEIFTNYSELDGLKNLIFSEAACCKSADGELHFGSLNGFYSFYPEEIKSEKKTPVITFVNLQLFNKDVKVNDESSILEQSIKYTNNITLNHRQSVFSIEYAGLFFQNPEKLEYAFMLDGYDNDWNYVRNQRKATYTDLPAGNYKFKVKCSISGNFEEIAGKELEIIILPPPWKTKWAYLGYLILIFLMIFFTRKIIVHIISLKHKVILEQQLTDLKLKFFTNISHELRTPLSLIIVPIEELLKDKNIREITREYLEVIDKNARRMLSHVNNLLDFRKIQTGKMRLNLSEIEIISFVKDIYEGFNQSAQMRNITFLFSSNVDFLNVWIDPEKMDTVIFNLLSNAFKFTPDGKNIEILINKLNYNDKFQLIIKDEGVGIPPEEIPYIFERFKVSKHTDDVLSKGTGIGLSLVKEMVELHKGSIEVDSIPDQGSTFTVNMFIGTDHYEEGEVNYDNISQDQYIHTHIVSDFETTDSSKKSQLYQSKLNAPVLLIIEDNVELRTYVRNKLCVNYKIIDAQDGKEGWKKALEHIPDLIISDIMMPGYNGIELVNMLRHDIKTSHIPIILLTAKSSIENEIEGLKYGADLYITKPFKMELLEVQIENLLNQRKQLIEKFSGDNLKVVELAPDEIVVTARDEEFIKKVIEVIEENMSSGDFNIEKIATEVNMGRTTFFKKLKGLTGMAPVEFLKDIKLKRGHQLLQTGEFTISEIAFKLGFNDAGYFTKCYKDKYKTTPTEILRSIKDKK